jgi:hypothetical protein
MEKLRLVIPVYNDWPSFRVLLRDLCRVAANPPARPHVCHRRKHLCYCACLCTGAPI